MARITNAQDNLTRLNQTLESTDQRLTNLETLAASLQVQVNDASLLNPQLVTNDVTFSWDGVNTVSWTSGRALASTGKYTHVSAGSASDFSASTTYWFAWNTAQKRMGYSTNLNKLYSNKNNLLLAQITTGGAGSPGSGGDTGGGIGKYPEPI